MVSFTRFRLQWVCQFCTYLNYSPATVCEMCDLARPEPAPLNRRPPSPVRRVPALSVKAKEPTPENQDSLRQRLMKDEGLKLIQLIRASPLHVSSRRSFNCTGKR